MTIRPLPGRRYKTRRGEIGQDVRYYPGSPRPFFMTLPGTMVAYLPDGSALIDRQEHPDDVMEDVGGDFSRIVLDLVEMRYRGRCHCTMNYEEALNA
jgi:hypothetical protein